MPNDTPELRKIIDRINKLLALSTSPNENEAASAAEKAQALLAEYNLETSDLNAVGNGFVADNDLLTDYAGWVKPLLSGVAKLYMCGYYFTSFPSAWVKQNKLDATNRRLVAGGHSITFLKHTFIGKRVNIIVTKQLCEYLISTMERLCKEAVVKYPPKERASARFSFMNACTARICYRLKQRLEDTAQHGIQNGTNLPALRPMYDEAQQAVQDFLDAMGTKVQSKKPLVKILHAGGMRDGQRAGQDIGLDEQLDGDSPSTNQIAK